MNAARKFTILIFFTFGMAGNIQAAKVNPADCLCHGAMIELAAAASCTDMHKFTREGKGKDWTKNLFFTEAGVCTVFNVSASGRDVDVFQGSPSGLLCDWDHTQRCSMDLSAVQLRACDVTLRVIKRDIRRLPDC